MLRVLVTGNRLLATDLSRLQKVVIARRIQGHVSQAPRVHEHVIEVPQVDIRNIFRQHLLNFRVQPLADTLIGLAAGLIDHTIDPGVGIKTAGWRLWAEIGWSGSITQIYPGPGYRRSSATNKLETRRW